MYVCMYLGMYTYVCMHAYMYVCVCMVCTDIDYRCMHIPLYMQMPGCRYVYMFV